MGVVTDALAWALGLQRGAPWHSDFSHMPRAVPPLGDIVSTVIANRKAKGFRYAPGAYERIIAAVAPTWDASPWVSSIDNPRLDALEIAIGREELYFHGKTMPEWIEIYQESLDALAA